MSKTKDVVIAVLGAGISGLRVYTRLRQAGIGAVLIDKSRGLGGRMATRRVGRFQFDHGAQFFTARTATFSALVEDLEANGLCALWQADRYVATPHMSAIGSSLLGRESNLHLNKMVKGIRREESGWALEVDGAESEIPGNGFFKGVVVAVPAPQALGIIGTKYSAFEKLKDADYAPCWTLMFAVEMPLKLDDLYVEYPNGHALRSISSNASKPGRPALKDLHTYVVHASANWSQTHLETDKQIVQDMLLREVAKTLNLSTTPAFVSAHRWRYAEVIRAVDVPCLWDSDIDLGACGDWCLGPRVEMAFESGEAIAARLINKYGRC